MATVPAVPVKIEDYLNAEYEPDRDYMDGVLEDRNVGKKKHSRMQRHLCALLQSRIQPLGKEALPEQRVRISASRVRIPDVCVVDADDQDEVQHRPPALWVEILSPEDRFSRIQLKLQQVLDFGVPTVWVIDPYEKQAWIGTTQTGIVHVKGDVLESGELNIRISLEEIFSVL